MIRVLGVDVPRGWAVVDVERQGQSHGVALGELEVGREAEHFVELLERYEVDEVAIETPIEPYVHGRGSKGGDGTKRAVLISLLSCARLAGRLEQAAIERGRRVTVADANTVRRALGIGGKTRTDRDRAVKQYVMTHIKGWPKISNADERDAGVVAVYGGLHALALRQD